MKQCLVICLTTSLPLTIQYFCLELYNNVFVPQSYYRLYYFFAIIADYRYEFGSKFQCFISKLRDEFCILPPTLKSTYSLVNWSINRTVDDIFADPFSKLSFLLKMHHCEQFLRIIFSAKLSLSICR